MDVIVFCFVSTLVLSWFQILVLVILVPHDGMILGVAWEVETDDEGLQKSFLRSAGGDVWSEKKHRKTMIHWKTASSSTLSYSWCLQSFFFFKTYESVNVNVTRRWFQAFEILPQMSQKRARKLRGKKTRWGSIKYSGPQMTKGRIPPNDIKQYISLGGLFIQ